MSRPVRLPLTGLLAAAVLAVPGCGEPAHVIPPPTEVAVTERLYLSATVRLYKALGGGWGRETPR